MSNQPETSNGNSQSPQPTTEQVLQLLDSEIDQVQSEQSRSGWTTWAMLGALAGIVWLIFSIWESGTSKSENVLRLFLIFSFAVEFFDLLHTLLSRRMFYHDITDRFHWATRLVGNRSMIVLLISRAILLIYLASIFSEGLTWYQLIPLYLFYGYRILEWLTGLVFDLFKLPLRITSGGYFGRILFSYIIVSLLAAWSIFGYLYTIVFSSAASPSDYRMASLLTAASLLILFLARGEKDAPLLYSLIEIRRYLAFGWIDVSTAIKQSDIVLSGMQVSDVLQEPVRRYLYLYEQMNNEYSEALKQIEALQTSLPDESTELSNQQRELVKAVFQSCQQHIQNISDLYEQGQKEEKKLRRIARWIHGGSPRVQKSIDEMLEYVSIANKDFFSRLPMLNEKLELLKRLWSSAKQEHGLQPSTNSAKTAP